MRLYIAPVILCLSLVAHAQAVAPEPAPPPAFPTPGYTPAGAGAAVVGQPGHQTPSPVPRSPNTRELPPSPEPGLWAADELRAAKSLRASAPDVDELLRPEPSEGAPALATCRARVRRAARESGLEEVRRSLPGINRECLTAQLLVQCFYREHHGFREAREKTPRTAEVIAQIERYHAESAEVIRWSERVCGGFLTLPIIEELKATILAHLERQFRRPETHK